MSAGECSRELRQPLQTHEFDIGSSQEMVHKPGRELSVRAAHSIHSPPKHWFSFDLSPEFGVGLVERRPTPFTSRYIHVEELAEIVSKTCQKTEVLPLRRIWRNAAKPGHRAWLCHLA